MLVGKRNTDARGTMQLAALALILSCGRPMYSGSERSASLLVPTSMTHGSTWGQESSRCNGSVAAHHILYICTDTRMPRPVQVHLSWGKHLG